MYNSLYRLEISHPREKVSFGPRKLGDVGRDILIIKHALGVVKRQAEIASDVGPNEDLSILDPNHWFDCVKGVPVSNVEAATFDKNLQKYITRFQTENQFYILSYLFSHYAIPETTEKIYAIRRRGSYQAPQIEEHETASTISPWVTSGANRTLLPAGKSISLSSRAEDSPTVQRYQTHQFLSKQVEKISSLYNSEFGSIGEATLAVMHGWLPRTTLSSQSYYYDAKTFEYLSQAHDLVLKPVHYSRFDDDSRDDGIQRSESEDENIISSFYNILDREDSQQVIEEYYRQVSLSEKIDFNLGEGPQVSTTSISYSLQDFSLVSYDVSKRPGATQPDGSGGYESILYKAIEQISDPANNIPRAENIRALSNKDYSEALNRISEPDPLIDPDPFVVNDSTIGYFNRTDYTLENLPPFMPTGGRPDSAANREYSAAIKLLEDKALTEILKFYGKPEIFYLDTRNEEFRKIFIDKSGNRLFFQDEDGNIFRPKEKNGSLLNSVYKQAIDSVWVLTTKHTEQALSLKQTNPGEYEIYQDFERYDNDTAPLIRFVEFVTPSLRPGDNYRAKFHINKVKLDFIVNGYTDKEQHNLLIQEFSEASKRSQSVINPLNKIDEDCSVDGESTSPEQISSPFTIGRSERDEKRRYQEYRALTSKRKKEIQRALREATLESFESNDGANSVNVDLGVLGNANLNFDTFSANPYDYTTGVLNTFGSLVSSGIDANISNPTLSKYTDLKISFPNLQSRVNLASSDLRKAYMASIKERITFNDTKFNGAKEALLLGNLPAELKQCIQRNKVPKDPPFRFGDEPFGIGEENYFDVSPLSRFTGTFLNEIQFTFDQVPGGMQISGLKAGDSYVPTSEIKKYRSLNNPRTVAYLAQIYDMTGGQLNQDLGLKSLFDFDVPACHEIGFGKRGLGYLKKYTPGLKGNLEEFNPISQWYQENVEDPFYKWVDRSKSNLSRTWNSSFNEDEMLQLLGKTCELRVIYKDFLKKLSIPGLLCDFIKCLRLPGFELKIPNFQLPPFPNIDIFGWYKNLIKFILKQFFDIVVRITCTFVRMIIDFLNFPFCQEQLRDQLYGELSSTSPIVQQAVVDGLTDLGIKMSDDNIDSVKDFAEQSLLFLTGEEVCRLLNGERIDPVSMSMLERLATKNGIDDLNSEDKIIEFFSTIGVFIPDGFCENLQSDALNNWALGSFGCDETTSYVDQIRKRMLAGGASDEEIDKAVELANKNLQDQADKLQALGEVGISDLLPDVINFGDPNAIINDLPPSLKEQSTTAAKGLFESARMAYLSSLSNFAPSLFLSAPRITRPPDPDFDYDSQIIVSTILERFKIFTLLVEEYEASNPGQPPGRTELIKRLNALYQVYETEGPIGQKVCKTYRWNPEAGIFSSANQNDFYTSDSGNLEPITLQQIAEAPSTLEVVLKPVGHVENGYYLPLPPDTPPAQIEQLRGTNQAPSAADAGSRFDLNSVECTRIIGEVISVPAISALDSPIDAPIPAICTVVPYEASNLAGFSFVMPLLMEVRAVELSKLNAEALPNASDQVLPDNLPDIMLNRILVNRITELRSELGFHLTRVSSIKQGNEYLGGIRELFSLTQENMLENLKIENRNQDSRAEVVDVATLDNGPIKLEINFGALQSGLKYQEYLDEQAREREDILESGVRRDAYTIKLYKDNMFRVRNSEGFLDPRTEDNAVEINVCDIIEINQDEKTLYSRRELLARRVANSLRSWSQLYSQVNFTDGQINSVANAFENEIYSKAMEGVFEQVFFATRQSRIYDEENYYPEFQRRVSGETYYNEDKQCYKNRFNVPQLAILSFDKIVTEELGSQISKELAKEEGYPYNIDYNSAGPVERAIQNVCLIGFIRICLVELLLKGSLVYTSWDFEEVFQEKSIQEFIFQYIKSELNRKESMRQNWKSMVSQITGIDNYEIALRKLVENQSMKLLDLSKEVFQNAPTAEGDEFLSWYAKNYVPQSHCSRNIQIVSGGRRPEIITETLVDTLGNIIGIRSGQDSGSRNLGDFYWMHPLKDSSNFDFLTRLARANGNAEPGASPAVSIEQLNANAQAASYLEGDDPFFHIEHYLEVVGPLASVESLVIPGRQIVDEIINIPDFSPGNLEESRRNKLTRIQANENRAVPQEHRAVGGAFAGQIRDREYMNISSARARFRNLMPFFERYYASYGFSSRPQIEGGAAGTAEERLVLIDRGDGNPGAVGDVQAPKYSELTEIFHIEDFISALRFALADSNLDKFRNHLLGLMHYVPDPDDFDYPVEDTQFRAAHEMPETIRRTPVRFIKKIRKIIKVKNDFLSHPYSDFYYGQGDILDYRAKIFTDPKKAYEFLETTGTEESNGFRNSFVNEVEEVQEEIRWFIVSANGEDIISILQQADESIFQQDADGRDIAGKSVSLPKSGTTMLYSSFSDGKHVEIYDNLSSNSSEFVKFLDQNKVKLKSGLEDTRPIRNISHHRVAGNNTSNFNETRAKIGGLLRVDLESSNGPSKLQLSTSQEGMGAITLGGPSDVINLVSGQQNEESKDFLRFQPEQLSNTTHEVFSNKIGEFLNNESYTFYKTQWKNSLGANLIDTLGESSAFVEEEWYETVVEFSGDSSILAGLYGSQTIGETMDPAVLNFIPDQQTKDKFINEVLPIIKNQLGQGDRFRSAYGNIYGPTFWYDREGDDSFAGGFGSTGNNIYGPFIARPMGIDKFTNFKFTSAILTNNGKSTRGGNDPKENYLSLISPFKHEVVDWATGRGTTDRPENVNMVSIFNSLEYISSKTPSVEGAQFGDWLRYNRPYWSIQGNQQQGDNKFDITRMYIHKTPKIGFRADDENVRSVSYPKLTLLPPNVYRVPLRLLLTQVFIENEVKAAYARFVAPKYIQNMAKDREVDVYRDYDPSQLIPLNQPRPPGLDPYLSSGPTSQNVSTLNQAMRNIFDDYGLFMSRMSLPDRTNRDAIVEQFFFGDNKQFPNFSRETYRELGFDNREATINPNAFNCEMKFDDPKIYCSIERIYSEAFEIETKQATWNSNQELDRLFSEDRGFLLRKTQNPIPSQKALEQVMKYTDDTIAIARGQSLGLNLRNPNNQEHVHNLGQSYNPSVVFNSKTNLINHLESLHYFYHSPVNKFAKGHSSQTFHRITFSIHNLLQWYLRSRTQDSLWGLLTPSDTSKHTSQYGLSGVQTQPLVQHSVYRSSEGRAGLQFAGHRSYYIPNAPWSHAMHRTSFDGTSFGTKADRMRFYFSSEKPQNNIQGRGDDNSNPYCHRYYYRPGVMTLMHDFAEYWKDSRSVGAKSFGPQATIHNNPKSIDNYDGDLSFRAWFINYRDFSKTDKIIDSTITRDGIGHYFVNYNRISGPHIKEYGSSMFYGDGRFSLADICNFFSSNITSIFRTTQQLKDSDGLPDVGAGQGRSPLTSLQSYVNTAVEGLFTNQATDGTTVYQTDFFKILFKLLESSTTNYEEVGITESVIRNAFGSLMGDGRDDAADSWLYPLRVSLGQPNRPLQTSILIGVPRENRVQSRFVNKLDNILDMQIEFLNEMIKKTGALAQYQVRTESCVNRDNVYSEQEKCLKAMEFMRRLLVFAKQKAPSFMSKLAVMTLACRHGFATNMVNMFDNRFNATIGGSSARTFSRARRIIDGAKYEQAKLGLYWFHVLVAGLALNDRTGLYNNGGDSPISGADEPAWADSGTSNYFVLRNKSLAGSLPRYTQALTRIFKLICMPGMFPVGSWSHRNEEQWMDTADKNWKSGKYCSFRINGRQIQDTYDNYTLSFRLGAGYSPFVDLRISTPSYSRDSVFSDFAGNGSLGHKVQGRPGGFARYAPMQPGKIYSDTVTEFNREPTEAITLDKMERFLPGGSLNYRASWRNAASAEGWARTIAADNDEANNTKEAPSIFLEAVNRGITSGRIDPTVGNRDFGPNYAIVFDYEPSGLINPTIDEILEDLETIVQNVRSESAGQDQWVRVFIETMTPAFNSDDWSLVTQNGISNLARNYGMEENVNSQFFYQGEERYLSGRDDGPRLRQTVINNSAPGAKTFEGEHQGDIGAALSSMRGYVSGQMNLQNNKVWPLYGASDQLAYVAYNIERKNYSPYANKNQIFTSAGRTTLAPVIYNVDAISRYFHFNKFDQDSVFREEDLYVIRRSRSEDFLSKMSFDEYKQLVKNQFIQDHLLLKGYSLTQSPGSENEYSAALSRNALLSPAGIFKHLANRMNVLLRKPPSLPGEDGPPLYMLIMYAMRSNWISAFESYTDIPQTLSRMIDNQEVVIGDTIVNNLLSMSKIYQKARLVFNVPRIKDIISDQQFTNLLSSDSLALLSQEQRSFYMNGVHRAGTAAMLSIPLTFKAEDVSTFGTGTSSDIFVDCYNLQNLKDKFELRAPWMAQQLLEQEDSKVYFEYIFPTKRYQALSTIFATTTLSGYSTMPTFMESPKASLSFLMNIAGLNSQERSRFFNNMSQSDLYKAFTDNKVSDARGMECFDLPFSTEFLEDFMSMLLEAIKEFPSLLFRGIASVVDPAYKEMKLHYQNCEINELTFGAINTKSADKIDRIDRRQNAANKGSLKAGLQFREDRKKDGKYSPLVSTFSRDMVYSFDELLSLTPNVKPLKYTMRHFINYLYKGPLSLFDGAFQFTIPCVEKADFSWDPSGALNSGRYGHPISPLTAIALAMPELKGDKKLREISGTCSIEDNNVAALYSRGSLEDPELQCEDVPPEAFGDKIPNPDDFK